LVAQREDLELEGGARSEASAERREEGTENCLHEVRRLPLSGGTPRESLTSVAFRETLLVTVASWPPDDVGWLRERLRALLSPELWSVAMSWDVLLFKAPHASAAEMPKDFRPDPLGGGDQVRHLLVRALPRLDFRDPMLGILDGQDWSIEFGIGHREPVDAIMLHVRGADDAILAVRAAAETLGAKAFDCGTGDFLAFDGDAATGLRSWRAMRDRTE
jgi:hypothetical protein